MPLSSPHSKKAELCDQILLKVWQESFILKKRENRIKLSYNIVDTGEDRVEGGEEKKTNLVKAGYIHQSS